MYVQYVGEARGECSCRLGNGRPVGLPLRGDSPGRVRRGSAGCCRVRPAHSSRTGETVEYHTLLVRGAVSGRSRSPPQRWPLRTYILYLPVYLKKDLDG